MTVKQAKKLDYNQVEQFYLIYKDLQNLYETTYGGPRNCMQFTEYFGLRNSMINCYNRICEITNSL